jgi:hypothetical protein
LLALRARAKAKKAKGQKAPPLKQSECPCCTPNAPQIAKTRARAFACAVQGIGDRVCCRPRDKVPVFQRQKTLGTALESALRCCGAASMVLWPDVRLLVDPGSAGCWFWCWTTGSLLCSRHWRRVIRTIASAEGRGTARSQVKPRRGGGMPDIFLRHCAVCARVGEESVNRTGFLEADPRLAIQSPSTSPTSVVSLQNNPTFVIT